MRSRLFGLSYFRSTAFSTASSSLSPSFIRRGTSGVPSFVFDIDGVLIRGRRVLPAGREALRELHDQHGRRKYPIVFLTNGGGYSEAARARHLEKMLGVPVNENQVVVAHTAMRELVDKYRKKKDCSVVVVGRSGCKEVAQGYGFERVVAVEEIGWVNTAATPFTDYSHLGEAPREVAELVKMPVAAVFVMTDSSDWGRDIQLLTDIVLSNGFRGSNGVPGENAVDFYFCNSDLLFPNEHTSPRLAAGAMRVAFETLMQQVHRKRLDYTLFGKPLRSQYRLVENRLAEQASEMNFDLFKSNQPIYAIGDTPASDVRGANNAGDPWVSVLVRTGNYKRDGNDPVDPAKLVAADAHSAVMHAVKSARRGDPEEGIIGL